MSYTNSYYQEDVEQAICQTIHMDNLAGHKILITGATGLIGSYIVDMLMHWNESQEKKDKVVVYASGRSEKRLRERFSCYKIQDELKFVEYDVTERITFDFPIDEIIHAASNAYPAVFQKDPVGTMMSNIYGTQALLDYGKKHGMKRFLFISSGEIYGQGDAHMEAFTEDYSGYVNPTEVRSCYPMSKRAAETLCVSYAQQYSVDAIIVRPSHTYGPNATKSDNRANVQFVNDVLQGRDIVMKSAGRQMRSYTYIADAASAILTVLINGESGKAYNIANKNARATIAEFAQILADLAGRKVIFQCPNELEKGQLTPIEKAVLDSSRLEQLGWRGNYDVQTGLKRILAILKNQ
jgi:nucleoside-diphosphate-sugar epimerase